MIDNLLLCIGAQKSGTTWLHSQLSDHPDVAFSDVKEVHYFNTIYNGSILLTRRKVEHLERLISKNRGALELYFTQLSQGKAVDPGIHRLLSPVDDKWYEDLFRTKHAKYAADFTPEYALLPKEGFENIKQVSARQKIIFIMRDPISRAKSAIQYYFQMNRVMPEEVTDEMIWSVAKKDFILNLSRYDQTINKVDSAFKREDVLFLFFEQVMLDKQRYADVLFDFLEIEKKMLVKEKSEEIVNKSRKIAFPIGLNEWLEKSLDSTYNFIRNRFGDNVGWGR